MLSLSALDSTIATGNYQPRKSKLNHPRTEQIKFNDHLNKIANKYSKTHPELSRALSLTRPSQSFEKFLDSGS